MNSVRIYTDGSLTGKGEFLILGWAFVAIDKGKIVKISYGHIFKPPELIAMRNVASELEAVIKAIGWAVESYDKITIIHDYLGCSEWVNGNWLTSNKFTQAYSLAIQYVMKETTIKFKFVRGHFKNKNQTDNKFNDLADRYAKMGAKLGTKGKVKLTKKEEELLGDKTIRRQLISIQ